MKNVSYKKGWNSGTNPSHVEPPPINLIKERCKGKADKYFVKLKLHRYPTPSTSDLYEYKMFLFDHGDTEELLF